MATAERVYTRRGSKLTVVDAKSGEVATTCETRYTPRRVILAGGSLLVACWEKMEVCNP